MDFYIDSASLREIKAAMWFPIRGITTNPTIVAREKKPLFLLLEELLELGLEEIHTQVIAESSAEIVEEAKLLMGVTPGKIIPKIPVTSNGLNAIRDLSQQGYTTTATGVHTIAQGLLAARCGAKFVAPYVNRIDGLGASGVAVSSELKHLFQIYNLPTRILAASVKTNYQLVGLLHGGVDSVTVEASFMEQIANHVATEQANVSFQQNWLKTYQTESLSSELL